MSWTWSTLTITVVLSGAIMVYLRCKYFFFLLASSLDTNRTPKRPLRARGGGLVCVSGAGKTPSPPSLGGGENFEFNGAPPLWTAGQVCLNACICAQNFWTSFFYWRKVSRKSSTLESKKKKKTDIPAKTEKEKVCVCLFEGSSKPLYHVHTCRNINFSNISQGSSEKKKFDLPCFDKSWWSINKIYGRFWQNRTPERKNRLA